MNPTVSFKKGVDCTAIDSRIILVIMVAAEVWYKLTGSNLTVTSLRDGKHSERSLHYSGKAVDLRTRDDDGVQWAPTIKTALCEELIKRLPREFDVVIEKTHIHVEHDPR